MYSPLGGRTVCPDQAWRYIAGFGHAGRLARCAAIWQYSECARVWTPPNETPEERCSDMLVKTITHVLVQISDSTAFTSPALAALLVPGLAAALLDIVFARWYKCAGAPTLHMQCCLGEKPRGRLRMAACLAGLVLHQCYLVAAIASAVLLCVVGRIVAERGLPSDVELRLQSVGAVADCARRGIVVAVAPRKIFVTCCLPMNAGSRLIVFCLGARSMRCRAAAVTIRPYTLWQASFWP